MGASCDTEPTKRKRPDRAEKLKERKGRVETVVKCALRRRICHDDKDTIINAIRQRVETYSQRACFASVALQGIVKEAFQGVQDVRNADIPDIFEQTFIRQLMLGTDDAQLPSPIVEDYYARHPELSPNGLTRYQGDRNIYSAGATKFLTNLKNSLVVNLERRVKRFAKSAASVWDLSDDERVSMVYDVLGWQNNVQAHGYCYPQRRDVFDIVVLQRNALGLDNGQRISKAWMKSPRNLSNMLRHAVALNRFQDTYELEKFNITPLCRVRCHYVTIDTSTLHGMLRELELVNANEEAFKALAQDHWRSIFDIDGVMGRSKTFTGTVETDGTSLCVHFTRPKNVNDAAGDEGKVRDVDYTTTRYVGIDPGREYIYFAAERYGTGLEEVRTWKLTRKAYYKESGVVQASRQTRTWSQGIREALQALSMASSKGVDMETHTVFVQTFVNTFQALWDEYSKPRWANQRLRLYGGKKRTFARFFNRLEKSDPDKDIVVGYGSAKYAPGGRFELSVPTSRAYKECVARFPTYPVDEYRTTMVHHDDDSILQHVMVKKTGRVTRGLLWCRSTNCSKFVNRDKNAALNILRCFVAPTRPQALRRTPDKQRIKHVVGKTIKC